MVIKMKKMNWRKIVCTVLMGAFVLQAAGCGGSGAENTTSKKEYVYDAGISKTEHRRWGGPGFRKGGYALR